jgi:hypothetical protein
MAGPGPICLRCHDDKWKLSARHWCDDCEAKETHMTRPGTMGRNVRVPDADWQAFRKLTAANGTSASAELLAHIRRYIKRHQQTAGGTTPR